jgi:hypothetical protein
VCSSFSSIQIAKELILDNFTSGTEILSDLQTARQTPRQTALLWPIDLIKHIIDTNDHSILSTEDIQYYTSTVSPLLLTDKSPLDEIHQYLNKMAE